VLISYGAKRACRTTWFPAGTDHVTGAGIAPRTLLAYFSRAGENYYHGGRRDLEVGNTEVLARMISELIDCDVHRIEAADPYPAGYDVTVARNVREQDADARPGIANLLASIAQYDVVLLGSPIWNVRAPMIMSTFTDSQDFTGKRVHPFVTYAVSGLGSIERDYATSCPKARIGAGWRCEAKRFPSVGPTSRPGCVRPGSPHDPTARASDPMNNQPNPRT
jgi:hypothetical protein